MKKKPASPPIVVKTPEYIRERMEAIVSLSKTVLELSRALNHSTTEINISNCDISGAKVGIHVTSSERDLVSLG